ncbi:hypothetical protein ACTG9Q_32830 [Actinokineospora sp. 24-640]
MATSNRVLGYLGSTKNLAGCVLGLVGVALWSFDLIGAIWPFVVAALYLAGVLAAPPEKIRLVDDAQSLREAHAALSTARPRLPAELRDRYTHLLDVLSSMVDRHADLAADPDAAHDVDRLLRSDIPLAVETYANLPWWLITSRASPADELATQLALLTADAEHVATRFFTTDLNRQSDHTRYLKDRAGPAADPVDPNPRFDRDQPRQ